MALGAKSKTMFAQEGATLIEVLVSFVLLAIGLLGVAALQVSSLRFNHDSYLRSQVSVMISDMVDRMRLNRDNLSGYITTFTVTNTTAPTCQSGVISAANDIACWQRELMVEGIRRKDTTNASAAEVIPAVPLGTVVSITNPSGNEYEISLAWTDRENVNRQFRYRFEP